MHVFFHFKCIHLPIRLAITLERCQPTCSIQWINNRFLLWHLNTQTRMFSRDGIKKTPTIVANKKQRSMKDKTESIFLLLLFLLGRESSEMYCVFIECKETFDRVHTLNAHSFTAWISCEETNSCRFNYMLNHFNFLQRFTCAFWRLLGALPNAEQKGSETNKMRVHRSKFSDCINRLPKASVNWHRRHTHSSSIAFQLYNS